MQKTMGWWAVTAASILINHRVAFSSSFKKSKKSTGSDNDYLSTRKRQEGKGNGRRKCPAGEVS